MSYSLFLILFICLPMVGFFFLLRGKIYSIHLKHIAVVALIALVYTTPWDNYLVATGVWHYDPKLVLNITIGYVPIEEYSFFVLQTFLTGAFVYWLWSRFHPDDLEVEEKAKHGEEY
jgi:lycopene beta-cyclase